MDPTSPSSIVYGASSAFSRARASWSTSSANLASGDVFVPFQRRPTDHASALAPSRINRRGSASTTSPAAASRAARSPLLVPHWPISTSTVAPRSLSAFSKRRQWTWAASRATIDSPLTAKPSIVVSSRPSVHVAAPATSATSARHAAARSARKRVAAPRLRRGSRVEIANGSRRRRGSEAMWDGAPLTRAARAGGAALQGGALAATSMRISRRIDAIQPRSCLYPKAEARPSKSAAGACLIRTMSLG